MKTLKSGFGRRAAAVAAAGTLAFSALALGPAVQAHATADGCSYAHGITVPYIGVYLPTTGVCVHVKGSGIHADEFYGNFDVSACNYRIELRSYRANGTIKWTSNSAVHNGCSYGTGGAAVMVRNVNLERGGKACAALWEGGVYTDQACVWIS